ncbi:MAG TPA: hypothetical protein VLF91_03465 [Candidatus Saccharimonadales bacterium]|nr:hypothetical protein [Candidatus Saccharimonadales bacterium]
MGNRQLSYEQTIEILTGPREIPADVTARTEAMLQDGTPIVDVDSFSEFLSDLMAETPANPLHAIEANFYSVVTLGACSLEMAWQQAGDLHIPRPRRLYEHNQSVLNTDDRVFVPGRTDPRDRLLKPMYSLQDGGKAHAVALSDPSDRRRNREQSVHNDRVAGNVLGPVPRDVLSPDEKAVIGLLIRQTVIGRALIRHGEKGMPLEEAVAPALAQLNELRTQCPDDYHDRFDDYLLMSYLVDAGAHTQRAQYVDAATGRVMTDVSHTDRFTPDGQETMRSLDRLFSEAPEDVGQLRLFQPAHLAVMRQLFPNHYEE